MEQLESDLRDHLISSLQDNPNLDLDGLMKIGSGFMANDMLSGGYAQRMVDKAQQQPSEPSGDGIASGNMMAMAPVTSTSHTESTDFLPDQADAEDVADDDAELAVGDGKVKKPVVPGGKSVAGAPSTSPDIKNKESNNVDPEYFVIHSTVGNLSRKTIEGMKGKQGKAHAYIMNNGDMINIVPFDQKAWATKSERQDRSLVGKMYHIELNYPGGGRPSEEMYNKLAETYKTLNEAAIKKGHTLTIVPHREVDRGIPDGHFDPENFDFNHFYEILGTKGVDVDKINKITQDRYLIPNMADHKSNWPPVLSGPAERKKAGH